MPNHPGGPPSHAVTLSGTRLSRYRTVETRGPHHVPRESLRRGGPGPIGQWDGNPATGVRSGDQPDQDLSGPNARSAAPRYPAIAFLDSSQPSRAANPVASDSPELLADSLIRNSPFAGGARHARSPRPTVPSRLRHGWPGAPWRGPAVFPGRRVDSTPARRRDVAESLMRQRILTLHGGTDAAPGSRRVLAADTPGRTRLDPRKPDQVGQPVRPACSVGEGPEWRPSSAGGPRSAAVPTAAGGRHSGYSHHRSTSLRSTATAISCSPQTVQ